MRASWSEISRTAKRVEDLQKNKTQKTQWVIWETQQNPKKPIVVVVVSERDTDSDIIKKPTPKGSLLDSIINEHTDDENLRKALREFVQYRNSNPKTKISDLGLTKSINQLTKMFGDNTADKIQSIDNTIANGWKGLFDIDKKGDKLTYGWQEELKAEQDKFDNQGYEPKRSAEEAKRKLDEL
jgi:hypothetical protein